MPRCNCEHSECLHEPGACANAANSGKIIFLGSVCLHCWLKYPPDCYEDSPRIDCEGESFPVLSEPQPGVLRVQTPEGPTMDIDTPPNGYTLAAQWRAERDELACEIKSARVTFKTRIRAGSEQPRELARLVQYFYRPRIRKAPINPARRDRMLRAFRNCMDFAREPIPYNLPCGADDAFGDRQDYARVVAAELRAVWKATA